MPKEYIPADVIESYVKQARQDTKFSRDLVLTGGEITSAYMHHSPDYVPKLLNMALDNECAVDIKTNAGWVAAKNQTREKIFNDLVGTLSAHSTSSFRVSPMQISLSLDRFHPHSLEKNTDFITEMSRRQKNSSCMIHVSSFDKDADMLGKLLDNLQKSGMKIQQLMVVGADSGDSRQKLNNSFWSVGNNVILRLSTGTLFDGGRAKNMPDAYHTPAPQFSFISPGPTPTILMAFDTFGSVTLGENSGRKIRTHWRNPDGTARPLADIRRDLVKQARKEEVRYNLETIKITNQRVFDVIANKVKNTLACVRTKKQEKSR